MPLQPPKTRAVRILAAMVSGGALAFVAPPANLWWLHWVSWVPLLWALYPGTVRQNLRLGYFAGWFGMCSIFFWVIETVERFSSLNYAMSIGILAIFGLAFGLYYAVTWGTAMWFRARFGWTWVLLTPAMHVAMENLSPALFPYYEGVTQYRIPELIQLASVTGSMGLTYLLFWFNCTVAEGLFRFMEGRRQPVRLYGALGAVLAVVVAFGSWRFAEAEAALADARVIQAGIIQQNTTMEQRRSEDVWQQLDSWVSRTQTIVDQKPDLVVWPEGAMHLTPTSERRFRKLGGHSPKSYLEAMTSAGDFHLLVGGGTVERGRNPDGSRWRTAYNSAYSVTRDGRVDKRYDKMVPLPFGEYIPLSETFPWLRDLVKGPGDFRKGKNPTKFDAVDSAGVPYTYSAPICYEGILSWALKPLANVDLLVNITNDAWFGDTGSPHQHAMLTAAQAVQWGRPLLRSAYTGISWVVEPHGTILYETKPFSEAAVVRPVRLGAFNTPYRRGGWVFPYVCSAFAFAAVAVGRRRSRSEAAHPPIEAGHPHNEGLGRDPA
ncbi:MAG: apolipoprotein N-acyltransferase [Myxococcota bacterium]|nr:apolipoprotein N-acyltransferase [Myxococcota bacterium]